MDIITFLKDLDKCSNVDFQVVAEKIENYLGEKIDLSPRGGNTPEDYLQSVLEAMSHSGLSEEYLYDVRRALYG